MVVGSDVEDDGEDSVGVNTGSEGVEGGLGGRDLQQAKAKGVETSLISLGFSSRKKGKARTNGDSSDSLVSNTENGLRVGDDDKVNGGVIVGVVLVELGLLLGRDGLAQVGLGIVGVQVRLELGPHAVRIGERDVASRGSSEEVRVVGDGLVLRTIVQSALVCVEGEGGERTSAAPGV